MPSETGFIVNAGAMAQFADLSSDTDAGEIFSAINSHYVIAPKTSDGPALNSNAGNETGYLDQKNYAHGVILDKIYFSPKKIDAGFIVADSEHEISIWNAFSVNKTINSILETNPLGTVLEISDPPVTLTGETSVEYLLTINKDGPPFQDTVYEFNISGQIFSLEIEGRRIEAWLYDPDWSDKIKFSYTFNTAIFRSRRFIEQRRPMQGALRQMELRMTYSADKQRQVHNDILGFTKKVLGIPIYTEGLTPTTSPMLGQTIITVSETISNLWNLSIAKFVLIKDLVDASISEIKEIASLNTGTKQITFTNAVGKSFVSASTVIYPIFVGILGQHSPVYKSDDILQQTMVFDELKA